MMDTENTRYLISKGWFPNKTGMSYLHDSHPGWNVFFSSSTAVELWLNDKAGDEEYCTDTGLLEDLLHRNGIK